MSSNEDPIKSIAVEFKSIYQRRLIFGQLICYAMLIFSVVGRAIFDQLGIWQGIVITSICLGWSYAFWGALSRERYHNFGKHDSRYEEVDSLRKHHSKHKSSVLLTVLTPIAVFCWIHFTLSDYMLNVARVEHLSQIHQRDTGIDYYRADQVEVNLGGFHWFSIEDTYKGKIQAVEVTGIIELERRDQGQSAYLYSKEYHSPRGNISKLQVPAIRERLYQQARQELMSTRVFEHKCLKRLRASENRKHHLETMQRAWGSHEPSRTLFLKDVNTHECHPSKLTAVVVWKYLNGCGALFIILMYLMRVMVRAQHNMARCMEAHEEKLEREAQRALANKKEYDSARDYPL